MCVCDSHMATMQDMFNFVPIIQYVPCTHVASHKATMYCTKCFVAICGECACKEHNGHGALIILSELDAHWQNFWGNEENRVVELQEKLAFLQSTMMQKKNVCATSSYIP